MKEVRIKNWKIDIGNYSYKLPKEAIEQIKAAEDTNCMVKWWKYRLTQEGKGIHHYIPYEDFEKLHKKCKNVTKDKLKEYSIQLMKDKFTNELSVYYDYNLSKKKAVTFRSSYEPKMSIKYDFIDEGTIEIIGVDDLDNLEKYNKDDFNMFPGNTFPYFVFVDKAMQYQYFPETDNIFEYCRFYSADLNTAVNLIFDHRGRKFTI